jgi:hypothetical protein
MRHFLKPLLILSSWNQRQCEDEDTGAYEECESRSRNLVAAEVDDELVKNSYVIVDTPCVQPKYLYYLKSRSLHQAFCVVPMFTPTSPTNKLLI